LQDDATPGNLAQAVQNLYDDAVTRRRIETLVGDIGKALAVDTGGLAAEALLAELDHAQRTRGTSLTYSSA
jgi:hypothetical protein